MRDRIGFKLLERTGPMFGVAVLVEEAALREYAPTLLQYFSTPPSGTNCKIAVKQDHWQRAHTFTIMSQEHAAWVVSLHESRPTHGVGALRIKSSACVCPHPHTRAGPRWFARLRLLARVHTVPGVQLMSCHACGWFIKGNTTQTVPGTAQEPARDARA